MRRRDVVELREILTVLQGIGQLLMSIDARLDDIVTLLGGEDEEADA